MAQVAAATAAQQFRSGYAVCAIDLSFDAIRCNRSRKAWPTRAGIELGIRAVQILAATRAAVDPFGFGIPILTGEGLLGALLAQHIKLLRCECLPPFGSGFF